MVHLNVLSQNQKGGERKRSASEPRQTLAVPSSEESLSRDSSKVTEPEENKPFRLYDEWQSPNTPILQINLCLTQGLKQHLSAEKKGNGQYNL